MSEVVTIPGVKMTSQRRYDVIAEIGGQLVKVECKSWYPKNAAQLTKCYLKAKSTKVDLSADSDELIDVAVEGQQLFADLLSWSQKEFKGYQWHFDDAESASIFKSTLLAEIKTKDMESLLMSVLGKTDTEVKLLVVDIEKNIDKFVEVVLKS